MRIITITLLTGPVYELELSIVSPEACLLPLKSPGLAEICMAIACRGVQHPDKPCAWIAPANISEVEISSVDKLQITKS
jgi:hypothetical protein